MIKRSFAGLLAGICAISNAALFSAVPAANAEDAGYTMNVSVDLSGEKKSVSPYIYGINDAGYLSDVTVNAVRQGGNRYSAYNWENNYSNAGSDWKNSSDNYLVSNYSSELAATPGACALHLSEDAVKNNVPYKTATIPMAGYVVADANGEVSSSEVAPSSRWKQVKATKGSEFSLTPDTTDDYVYMDEYVNYLVSKLGDSTTATGINGYNLDNEPALWSSTHSLMHPDKTTYKEMVEKSTEYAKAIKSVDPNADVYGLALFGVYAYYNLADAPDKDSSYDWFLSYYLDKMAQAEKDAGMRLIDAIDVHYYSEAKGDNRVTEGNATTANDIAARVQAPRSLYEDGFREKSWLTDTLSQYMPFLPTIQNSIDKYYPGTKLAITEYNFGGGNHVSGAIAEADALGAFAENDVYLATLWPLSSDIAYQLSAIDLYTNYDGKGSSFGDTLVSAKTDDSSLATAYASISGSDETKVTMVLNNKDADKKENAEITISGTDKQYKSAVVYGITGEKSDIQVLDIQNDLSGNKISIDLPALSVAQVVLSTENVDPDDVKKPEKQEDFVEYQFSELEESQNGYPMIPIKDAKRLSKIVINTTATSSANSSWFSGGGGLCFNKLILADGTSVWASKSFSYSSGTGNSVVKFDGTFNIPDPDDSTKSITVEGEIGDTFIELQDWWKSSEADSAKGSDVSVTYNSVTVYYDTESEEPTTTTTTTTTTTATSAPATDENYLAGDANCDAKIDISDAVMILQSIANNDKYGPDGTDPTHITEQGMKNADCSSYGDGVTTKDALAVQKFVVGLITLPEE